ncbi:hypothetical protein [Frankia sp. CcI49]|uniref:hypothetical protein n=1 Tax=Frankia sp. CcI49 TaxID=1745382 RepID=UPI001055BFB8|nr:hypothetical protein [Frankia sp. CcI49]
MIAATGEIMAVSAMIEIRARRRDGSRAVFPIFVLIASIAWSGACNLRAAAGLTSDPGPWRYIAALWVVIAFGLVAGIKATRTTHEPVSAVAPMTSEDSAPVALVDVAPVDESPVVEPTEPEPAPGDEPVVEPLETPKPAASAPKQSPARKSTKPTPAPKLTKKAQLLALWSAVSPDDRRSEAQIVGEIAAQIDLAPSTARRYVAESKRTAPIAAPVADITADEPVVVAVAA